MKTILCIFALGILAIAQFTEAKALSSDDRIAQLEAKVELLTRRVEILENDLNQTVQARCPYHWVTGDTIGLQGEARNWLFPVIEGCRHNDIRL